MRTIRPVQEIGKMNWSTLISAKRRKKKNEKREIGRHKNGGGGPTKSKEAALSGRLEEGGLLLGKGERGRADVETGGEGAKKAAERQRRRRKEIGRTDFRV